MQDPVTRATSFSERSSMARRWIGRHPYWSALIFFAYFQGCFLLLHYLLGAVFKAIRLPFLQTALLGEVLLALVVALPILALNWWEETGFTRGINGRGVTLCILPFVLVVLPVLLGLPAIMGQTTYSMIITTLALVILIGFVEEGLCRGLLLRSLLPGGIWPAVLLSSLFFAGLHLANAISGLPWSYIAGQLLIAFGSGVLFAALRLRTRSIWPSLVLHAAHDFPGLLLLALNPKIALSVSLDLALIVNGVFCVFFLLNAWVLLRPEQMRILRVVYELAPASTTTVVPNASYAPYQLPSYPGYVAAPPPYPTYTEQQSGDGHRPQSRERPPTAP